MKMGPRTKAELKRLLENVESSGRIFDDSQQDVNEAAEAATREEVKALKDLVVSLTKAVLDGP